MSTEALPTRFLQPLLAVHTRESMNALSRRSTDSGGTTCGPTPAPPPGRLTATRALLIPRARHANAAPLTGTVRATRLEVVRIELNYDGAGSRLHSIGDFQLSYDKLGSRPKTLGRLDLDYDMAGNRLRRVGADLIEYDMAGGRPARFGNLDLAYDRLGSRIVRIGTMGVDYDMAGNRVRRIGGLTVDYDKLGSRPRYLRADGEQLLDEQMCVIVFLILVAFNQA